MARLCKFDCRCRIATLWLPKTPFSSENPEVPIIREIMMTRVRSIAHTTPLEVRVQNAQNGARSGVAPNQAT